MLPSKKTKFTLGFEAVRNGRYDEHLDLLLNGSEAYPELAMALQQITKEDFAELFCRVGEVITISINDKYAGFCWIEVRGRILHLHSLVIKDEYRGRGFSREVLKRLENSYRGIVIAIEMGLHKSNERGLAYFQREGFVKHEIIDDIGFFILHKSLTEES